MTQLPPGWTEVALGDVALVDRSTVTAAEIADGTLYVGLEDIEAGGAEVRSHPVESGQLASNKFRFDRSHILYGKLRPYLAKIAAAPVEGICSTDILPIRPTGVDQRYLLHFLRQPAMVEHATARSSGANLPRLAPKELERFGVPLPPLGEQRRIAAILDKADELRAKRRAALEQLDSLTQSVFLDMFGDPVENPRGWPRSSLGALLKSIDSGQSPVCLKEPAPFGEWGVLKLGAVSFGRFDPSENKRLPESSLPDPRHEVRPGDVLFSRKNTSQLVAACVYVDDTPPRLLLSDLIFRLRIADDAQVLPRYLVSALQSPRMKRTVQSLATGAAASMPNISKQKLMSVSLPVPDLELQARFERACETVDTARHGGTSGEQTAQALFESLQSRAFCGEL